MEHYRITDRNLDQARGRPVELDDACMTALLAMSHYAEHPTDATEYELELAIREVRRLRRVRRWRGGAH